jgi:tRNA threonylcarbamoyladenosine biosynthesis protein TsaE
MIVHSSGPDQTRQVAARVARLLQPGDVILLDGGLGAGKTTFVQGLAEALGVGPAVTSPTFVLMNIHPTAAGFDLVHADLYRLERLSEVVDLGVAEMVDGGAVAVVEWGDRGAAALPPGRLRVRLEPAGGDDERRITLLAEGGGWPERLCR